MAMITRQMRMEESRRLKENCDWIRGKEAHITKEMLA